MTNQSHLYMLIKPRYILCLHKKGNREITIHANMLQKVFT